MSRTSLASGSGGARKGFRDARSERISGLGKCHGRRPQVRVSRLVVLRAAGSTLARERIHSSGGDRAHKHAPDHAVVDAGELGQLLRGSGTVLSSQRQHDLDELLVPEQRSRDLASRLTVHSIESKV